MGILMLRDRCHDLGFAHVGFGIFGICVYMYMCGLMYIYMICSVLTCFKLVSCLYNM